jgi:hypothetical protein
MDGQRAQSEESSNACRILVGKLPGKRQLGRQRRRYDCGIKPDLRK